MKNLIVYMSHHGTTRKVVQQLIQELGERNTTAINLNENPVPDLDGFDTIIIGGSIYMGQIQTAIKKFCNENLRALLSKRIGLFSCFMNMGNGQKEFEDAFPFELRAHSSANGLFGGELLFDQMNFMERLMMKKVKRVNQNVFAPNHEAIEAFSQVMHE